LFTTASIRGTLHNIFYSGKVTYRGKVLPGKHQALISEEVFEIVQTVLKKNSGRSKTLTVKPQRQYLLKGIIRCAYCGLPMSSQTYYYGNAYYREHNALRSSRFCNRGAAITCRIIDDQIDALVSAIELGSQWLEEVLSIISLKDEVHRIKQERLQVEEKIRRMVKTYHDGLFPDEEYYRQRKLLLTMLDAVYVDAKKTKSIVAIRPKPPFKPIFQVAVTKEGSQIHILNEPYQGSSVFLVETGES